MSIRRFKKSVLDAWHGVVYVYRHEQNFRIQIVLAIFIVILMLVLRLRKSEMVVILLLVFLVFILELLNSALEKLLDILKPRLQLQVALVKDIMAAMVLIASIGALIIGSLIFLPYIFN